MKVAWTLVQDNQLILQNKHSGSSTFKDQNTAGGSYSFFNRDMASVNPEKRHSCKSTGWAISSGSSARWWPSRPWGTSCWWIYPCSQAEPSFCPCQSWGPGKKWILGKLHFHKLKSSRILRNNQSDSWVHYLCPHLPHVLEHHVTVAIKSTNPTK